MKEILVVDDDIYVGNVIEEILRREGYSVSRAYSGTEALLYLSQVSPISQTSLTFPASQTSQVKPEKLGKPDLVLLDLMLPGLNGEEVLPLLKGAPVIVVSAKADIENKVELLLGGAVDYVTKPFHPKELLARIAVQLRAASDVKTTDVSEEPGRLIFDNLTIDTGTHAVSVGSHEIKLTRTEYAILKLLMRNPTQVITKSLLLDRISEDTPDCTESSLKTHVSHLRAKLREAGGRDYIESVWGIGYKMQELSISTISQPFS